VSSTYPNQEGASQGRTYTLKDGVMITRGVPRPNGDVTVTAWKRVK